MRAGDAGAARGAEGDLEDLIQIRRRLLKWGEQNRRSFPWRETRDPWRILLAEVLLHRTRADQVVPVYRAMIARYPDPETLARARLPELRRQMGSLGLRWRIPLLREMARQILRRHGGRVPEDREDLLALPGVSDYIAGAVRALAFGQPDPVLDTNTVRVLGRLFGLPIRESSRRSRSFREMMRQLMAGERPGDLLLAMLDLAAILCLPRNPRCPECPLQDLCSHGRAYGTARRASGGAGEGGSGTPGRTV